MTNLSFFKACWSNELASTVALLESLPSNRMDYRPHPVNRSAYEIVEHLLGHVVDLEVILQKSSCDETLTYRFDTPADAAKRYVELAAVVSQTLESLNDEKWTNEAVELTVAGSPLVTLPRMQMMWFFFFDIIHHRGQLSSYVRPMGGKNPAIYGYSADTI